MKTLECQNYLLLKQVIIRVKTFASQVTLPTWQTRKQLGIKILTHSFLTEANS